MFDGLLVINFRNRIVIIEKNERLGCCEKGD